MSSPKEAASTALPPTKTTGSPATAKAGALPATTRANGKAAPAKGKEADPAAYADLVQARINALEGVESAEDQAEKKSGQSAEGSDGGEDGGWSRRRSCLAKLTTSPPSLPILLRLPPAIDARKSVKDVDHASLEVKYMDLVRLSLLLLSTGRRDVGPGWMSSSSPTCFLLPPGRVPSPAARGRSSSKR